jgi:hypothetical protein
MTEIDTARILVERYSGEAEACRKKADTADMIAQPADRDAWLLVWAGWLMLAEEAKAKAPE